MAGHLGDQDRARRGLFDPDARVRAVALGALVRLRALRLRDVLDGLEDPSPTVRRRAVEAGIGLSGTGSRSTLPAALLRALDDPDPLVVDGACWALGERRVHAAVPALAQTAIRHPDTRCREAAVAALGAIGDRTGLSAVLQALEDKPTVRRRAVVALAAFSGPEVDTALERSLKDRDWQVRQATEALLRD